MSTDEPVPLSGNATRERLAWAAEAEALFRRILAVLGYDAADALTPADLIVSLTAWAGLVQLFRAEPSSPVADLWRQMYGASYAGSAMLSKYTRRADALEEANEACAAFLRRFPSRFEPVDRQALGDLAAMREALDEQTEATERAREEAEGLRKIADAAEQRADEIVREHAEARIAFATIGVDANRPLADCVKYYADYHARQMRAADETKAGLVERAEKAERELAAMRAIMNDRSALVPLPKPERVEPGQRWVFVDDVAKVHGDTAKLLMGEDADARWMIESQDWIYLGPAPTSEG